MWTNTTRALYAREGLTLLSDLTDGEWLVLEPLLPPACHAGRPRKWPLRRIIEAMLYLLRGGLPWRMPPPCFPPVSMVRRWFYLWRDNKLWLSLHHGLLLTACEATGRETSPSAGVIASQSVKTTESGGPRGYDAGKKIMLEIDVGISRSRRSALTKRSNRNSVRTGSIKVMPRQ